AIGASKQTQQPFDVMIEGQGFFPVQMNDGQIAYTRDGQFKKDPTGQLVDKNGNPLQPQIVIPPNASSVSISPTGQVEVVIGNGPETQNIGQIELVNFVNPAGLRSIGKTLFVPSTSSGLPQQGLPGQ